MEKLAARTSFRNSFVDVLEIPHLDPANSLFSLKLWMENLLGLLRQDVDDNPSRSAGVSFANLSVYGHRSQTDYQRTVGNVFLSAARYFIGRGKRQRVKILSDLHGVVEAGEMLLVLGRPGSGCSTFLKSISGDTNGFVITTGSSINYQGIPPEQMHSQYRGETIYMAENDAHFPSLTVRQTLLFAARARAPPSNTVMGVSQMDYAKHMTDAMISALNLQSTADTKIGNYANPGISGGEKKRVSIVEALLSGSPLQCWDNSTRGLDSAVSAAFINLLRLNSKIMNTTTLVSLYQASENTYHTFDKILLLYDGKQIYFGDTTNAKKYFEAMGFFCAPRKTTADFLTGVTSSQDRMILPGYHDRVPRSAKEFAKMWTASPECASILKDIKSFDDKYPLNGPSVAAFNKSRRIQQAVGQRAKSPYMLSIPQQIKLCVDRGFQRLLGDATITISRVVANCILAIIVATMFVNLKATTESFNRRSVLIFLAILLNAFASALEILLLYEQRPIIEKQARYGWYHPYAEAVASTICDIPFKICNSVVFNLVIYFIANLRREPAPFFVFLLFSLTITFTLSMVFRTFGALSRTLAQALPFSSLSILALMIYTGFVVPIKNMPGWFRWINYLNPIAYTFEALMINEYHDRKFDCAEFVPQGPEYSVEGDSRICNVVGSISGQDFVLGDDYIRLSYSFVHAHLWRNFGIILALLAFYTATYLLATEFVSAQKSKGEVLLFKRGSKLFPDNDVEKACRSETTIGSHSPEVILSAKFKAHLSKHNSSFQWKDICYGIKIKNGVMQILDHVDGYVQPGTLTAVMGPSGAGKTTLLNVLANRDLTGITSGKVLVNGGPRDISFQRRIGYAQQEDITLETMTVREACQFNAILCQSSVYSRQEKLEYTEEVINILGMREYADAVIGLPGEGLNIEQRKKLTIAIELSARLGLLLFLDEPTSGLDSQTAAMTVDILRELSQSGQAIVCTIHQPSTFLFEQFDYLLLLTSNGKPAYFGEIGENGDIVVEYFTKHGAKRPSKGINPAEWLFDVLAGTSSALESTLPTDWGQVWRSSNEFVMFQMHLDQIEMDSKQLAIASSQTDLDEVEPNREFAAPFTTQLWECFKRVNQQYWRSPIYIYSKIFSCLGSALFLGLTFYKTDNSLQGLQTQTFSIFMLLSQASIIIPQILPNFVLQRSLYEARERPAKTYSWHVFMISNILVELPWNTLMAVLIYVVWYFPIGLWRNAIPTDTVAERAGMMLLFLWVYMMLASTCGHMVQAAVEVVDLGANYVNLLFMISLIFCGVLVSPSSLPAFWRWVNRVVPFTYLVDGVLSVGLAHASVHCSAIELLHFIPLPGRSCGAYMAPHISAFGGYLVDSANMTACEYCPIDSTDQFLDYVDARYERRWMDFGVLWVYVVFNVVAALGLYWLFRVPKRMKEVREAEVKVVADEVGETKGNNTA